MGKGDFFQKTLDNKVAAALLAAACFFVYANALNNQFVWDDEEQVVNNAVIRDWNNFPLIFTSSTFYAGGAGLSGGFYRPLVTLSYFWNYSYWGLNPFGYHLMQLLFHWANSFLIFYLVKKILANNKKKSADFAAFAVALLFAVHPANVESVAYIGSIGEVVYAFFSLLAIIFFSSSFDSAGNIIKPKFFWLSFLMVFTGLLAKESAVIVLFLMLAYILLFSRPSRLLFVKFMAGAAAAFGSYLFLRLIVANIQAVPQHYAPIYYAPLWQRLLTLPQEVFSYLGILFFPKDLSISRHFLVDSASGSLFWQPLVLLILICAAALFYFYRTKSRVFLFFLLWFAITLAPVLNIIPLDMTMAERWLYFPAIGMLAALIVAIFDFFGKSRLKFILPLIFICALLLGARAVVRNNDWENGLALYGRDIAIASKVSPQGSFDLENNYGVELFRAGFYSQAEDHFKISLSLQPKWASSQNNYGAALEKKGDLDGALKQYRISADMGYYLAYENVAGILIKTKKYDDAKTYLEESLGKLPDNGNLQYYLALLYAADNIDNAADSKQKAAYLLERILRADPQNQQAQYLYSILRNGEPVEI